MAAIVLFLPVTRGAKFHGWSGAATSISCIWAIPFCPACRTELQERKERLVSRLFSVRSHLDCRRQEKTDGSAKEEKNVSVMMLGDCCALAW